MCFERRLLMEDVKILSKHLFDRSIAYEQPPIAIGLGESIFGTLGNFSMIIGKAKSKKTYLITALIASLTSKRKILSFEGKLSSQYKTVLFDTEQSLYHISLLDKRVAKLSDVTKNNFDIYALRPVSTSERLKHVEEVIKNYNNIGVVIIDGIRDLIKDFNSPDEASMIADKLLQLTSTYNIHIVVILHQNKGNDFARGHLGTELQNKAETIASVTVDNYDKNISKVSAEMTRNRPFDDFAFCIENDIPSLTEISSIETSMSLTPESVGNEKIEQILMDAFKKKKNYTGKELRTVFRKVLEIGDSKARDFVTYSTKQGLINNNSKNKTRHSFNLGEQLEARQLNVFGYENK